MKTRTFGKTGWQIGEVGLGTWQLGGDWGNVDAGVANRLLAAAVDKGVTFFDTADVYGGGKSEEVIGGFLAGCKEQVVVATKLGRLAGYPDGYSLPLFRKCVEDSIRRLKRDVVDVVQLHCIPERHLVSGEVFDWLRELVVEGKIRAYGASVETIDEAKICLNQPDIASLQIIFNIFRQKPAGELFSLAKKSRTALIIRLPLASGLLSGKMDASTTFLPSDHRSYNKDGQAFSAGETFSGLEFGYGLACVDKVKKILPENVPLSQSAIRFILDHDAVSVVIPGASKESQVIANCAASDAEPLDKTVHASLRKLYDEAIDGRIRGRK